MTHTKQLLFVTFCDMTAGIGPSFLTQTRTDAHTEPQTDGWSDRRGSRNCYLDETVA